VVRDRAGGTEPLGATKECVTELLFAVS
jgi:hypothetical protein